jgi:Mce-associated membrane protein
MTDANSDDSGTPDPQVVEIGTPAIELSHDDTDDAPAQVTADRFDAEPAPVSQRGFSFVRMVAFGLLPVLALLLGATTGYLKWTDSSLRAAARAQAESVQVAKDSTVAMLSYTAENVDKDLAAARDRLTGTFLSAYTDLVNNVVVPGAKERQISSVAQVPAAASVTAKPDHAVVLLFVNQTVVMGTDPPTNTTSSVRVTLDKVGNRWLISGFDPV